MGLVDYSSDSDPVSDPESTTTTTSTNPAKRRKTASAVTAASRKKPPPPPPPLPAAFHDLYASTVRISTVDDPSLHQGRKRVNPHRIGSWPSHLYIDIRPAGHERALLEDLVARIAARLAASSDPGDSGGDNDDDDNGADKAAPALGRAKRHDAIPIHSFLSSDLGAPQPLHISLSRPLSLQTAAKDDFLARAREAVAGNGAGTGGGAVTPFDLCVKGVYWHHTRESARSFLVLKVASSSVRSHGRGGGDGGRVAEDGGGVERQADDGTAPATTNPELQSLLQRLNSLAMEFGQPALYAATRTPAAAPTIMMTTTTTTTRDAFHVSIAWSPAEPTPRLRGITADIAREFFLPRKPSAGTPPPPPPPSTAAPTWTNGADEPGSTGSTKGGLAGMTLHVDAVKLKIGNVVTSIPLASS
ncbi:U6 snRNA phosphodiesterase Usb1 [Microdochium bolleyi]|uniref:U6 snRNA phosphodiesterase 1 n=1 Tax=Microdochium bolleyi TaxID=196109 RepID=A0A136J386_9PEZI|nr:U6 snRNA phosphodiesterase Usb1 [Microdochium bolleyi]